jgi:aminoglycoside phosphotransferase (APT) family kinase protein
MLPAADAEIVQRDEDVPALSIVLDPVAFGEALQTAYPAVNVQRVEPRYVRYKRGTSCLVAYEVITPGGSLPVYARAHGAATRDKMRKAAQRDGVDSPLGTGIAALEQVGVVIFPFPNDHELPALRCLGDDASRREMLEELLPERADLWSGRLEMVRYKPERRFVARLEGSDGPHAVLKFYTREDYHAVRDTLRVFDPAPPLCVPEWLGRSKRYRVAASAWLAGTPWRDELRRTRGVAPEETCRRIGAALAAMHGQKSRKIQVVQTSEDHARTLVESAKAVVEVAPEAGARARALAERIGARFVARHWRTRRAIHGDLSADQLIVDDGAIGVVDFDRASYGDPRLDLATLRARLVYDVICDDIDEDAADRSFAAVLDGYRDATDKDVTRKLDRFTAASLLRCAVEPFRYRRPGWPALVSAIVDRAAALAERART